MSFTNEDFFNENIVAVNKKVCFILLSSVLVAVSYIVLSAVGIWMVPNDYSIKLALYSLFSALVVHLLNNYQKTQVISMYVGIMASSLFVYFLGNEGYINITVAYAFGPFLSCLYYNRRLVLVTTAANFLLVIFVFWHRSFEVITVLSGVESQLGYFFSHGIGVVVEFVFVFLIAGSLARRTNQTLTDFMKSVQERDHAYELLKENNASITQLNSDDEKSS